MRSVFLAIALFFALASSACAHERELPGYYHYHPYYGWSNTNPYRQYGGYYYGHCPDRHYRGRYGEHRSRQEFHYNGRRWGYSYYGY